MKAKIVLQREFIACSEGERRWGRPSKAVTSVLA